MVLVGDVAVDGSLQIGDRAERATFEPPPCEGGEEALHGVEPGSACRREVEDPSRMTNQPGAQLWVFVMA
jgi:hypothetical protein